MNIFSEQMVAIATLEPKNQKKELLEEITLDQLLNPLATEFDELSVKKPISFKTMISNGETRFYANHYQLASAIRNLLDNAFKFTPANGEVELTGRTENNKLLISVRDKGIGIKAEEMPKLFTEFHRGTSTMVYDYEGTGIGLYITKLIVEQHGGKIYVQSQVGVGSSFTVEIPLLAPNSAESLPEAKSLQ